MKHQILNYLLSANEHIFVICHCRSYGVEVKTVCRSCCVADGVGRTRKDAH